MSEEGVVLCGANSYEQKYYLNPAFEGLPETIQKELQIMCVMFTEDIGGILLLMYDADGTLKFKVQAAEEDYLFDEIGCGLEVKRLQMERRELLESLELYYKVFFLHQKIDFGEKD